MTTLPKDRTIASLTKKIDILKLPGFEDLDHCTAKELKEYVKKRVAVYAKNASKNTRGFTVGDYMEIYKKDPRPYNPVKRQAIENLRYDINQIANNVREAKEDLKEFEVDKTNESQAKAKALQDELMKEHEKERARRAALSEEERKKEDEERKRKREEEKAALKAKKAAQEEEEFLAIQRRNREELEREQAAYDRMWEENKRRREEEERQQEEAFERRFIQDQTMDAIEGLKFTKQKYGKDSKEFKNAVENIKDGYGEEVYQNVLKHFYK